MHRSSYIKRLGAIFNASASAGSSRVRERRSGFRRPRVSIWAIARYAFFRRTGSSLTVSAASFLAVHRSAWRTRTTLRPKLMPKLERLPKKEAPAQWRALHRLRYVWNDQTYRAPPNRWRCHVIPGDANGQHSARLIRRLFMSAKSSSVRFRFSPLREDTA